MQQNNVQFLPRTATYVVQIFVKLWRERKRQTQDLPNTTSQMLVPLSRWTHSKGTEASLLILTVTAKPHPSLTQLKVPAFTVDLFSPKLMVTQKNYVCRESYHIVGNFQGRKLSQSGENAIFADCSHLPHQRTLHPQISWRKLLESLKSFLLCSMQS